MGYNPGREGERDGDEDGVREGDAQPYLVQSLIMSIIRRSSSFTDKLYVLPLFRLVYIGKCPL